MPKVLSFTDTRAPLIRLKENKEQIKKDFLDDLSIPHEEAVANLAGKYNISPSMLSTHLSRWGFTHLRNGKKLGLTKSAKSLICKKIKAMPLNSSIQEVQEALHQYIKDHERSMHGHIVTIHRQIEGHAESNPQDLDDRIRWIEGVDRIARRLYGMKEEEKVDPTKMGIAFLAYGQQPRESLPMKQAEVVEVEAFDEDNA